MNDKLSVKYVPPSYYARILVKWHQFSRGNKSAKEHIAKFDEFLIRCNVLVTESETQILFKFRGSLRKDLRTELLARGVIEPEKAYALVQDLDVITSNHAFRSHDQRA